MYQVLYRKWRPQTFSDVSGQPMITEALKNETRTGRVAHAYLFTGSRGTGKTSCAKILAKAVNCLDLQQGDPCNQCDACHGIDNGSVLDVVEIDAASNNGVDSIRDLREEVNFTPAVVRYRVYIIDEVHMLSTGAFNALLKTLEEPPSHVIFVLATTEVHKLPATILSRCQRFDFQRISPDDIAARLSYVAGQEDFSLTQEAALLIARLADGGMRDALSLLDQCASPGGEVTAETVANVAGLAGRDYLFALSAAVRTKDGGKALALIGQLHEASRDMERVCAEFLAFYRNLMVIKSVPNPADLIVAPPSEMERLAEEAARYELPALLHCMDTLQDVLERLRGGGSRRVGMEMGMLRLCAPSLDKGTDALLRRIDTMEAAIRAGAAPVPSVQPVSAEPPSQTPPAVAIPSSDLAETSPPPSAPAPPAPSSGSGTDAGPFSGWKDVIKALASSSPPLFGVLQDSTAFLHGDRLLVETDNELFKSLVKSDANKTALLNAVRSVTGRGYRIGVRKKTTAVPSEDPLSAFIHSTRELGLDVDVAGED